jgi:type VI secretion system secreted protein VgrG
MNRTITVTSPAMPQLLGQGALELQSLNGTEALGHLFHYRLLLVTPDNPLITEVMASNIAFKELVGKEISVRIELEGKGRFIPGIPGGLGQSGVGAGVREINGLVTAARFVRSENRRGVYEVVVEPWLALAERTSDHKIFQNMTVAEILKDVLSDYPFSSIVRLTHTYPKREFQVQYGETDLVFLERLMQEWGIYYYFEHANGVHRLIVVDDSGNHRLFASEAYQTIHFYPPGHKIDEEYCSDFSLHESLQSGEWVTSDFDFKKPRANLQTNAAMPRKTGHAQMQMYQWPGDYGDPGEGKNMVSVRMQEAGTPGSRARGSGNLRAIVPGFTFTLQGHPQQKANIDYLVIRGTLSIEETGHSSGQSGYACHTQFEVQPANNIYRSSQRHAKPHTHGPQTAIVTGPAGREIWTDQYGRIKVSFHWNRYCTKDQNSSCWVRVSNPWAGNNFGAMAIPRIGQEVIVDFENGDPDRPIITGRVYNALNMPPWDLPANQTQSGILTRSTEGGGPANANALRFEDLKGKEEVWLHAEKDQRIEVENDESHWVGHDRKKTIDHDETNHIKNDRTETVDGHEKITVHKTRTEEVDGDETLTVHSNRTRTVDGTETETIKRFKIENILYGHIQSVGLGKMANVGAAYSINVGAIMSTVVGMSYKLNVAKNASEQVGQDRSTNVGKNYTIEVGDTFSIKVGESVLVMKSDGTITINGKTVGVVGTSHVAMESKLIDMN